MLDWEVRVFTQENAFTAVHLLRDLLTRITRVGMEKQPLLFSSCET